VKYSRAISASVVFLAIYIAIYFVHISYFRVNVVFYSAIYDGIAAVFLTLLITFFFPWLKIFSVFEKTQLMIIWLLMAYALAISLPTVIDRSLSFYILEKLEQRGGGIQLARFEEVFTEEYLYEHRLIDVRLTEQQESGTIVIENGCVMLTELGKKITIFSRYFRSHFLPKQRLLMGEYTDDLTDPFRDATKRADYSCD